MCGKIAAHFRGKERKGTKTASAGRGGGDLMETTQTAQRRVRYQFESFCMKVIDGERCDYFRQLTPLTAIQQSSISSTFTVIRFQ